MLEKQINETSEAIVHQLTKLTQLQERYREFRTGEHGKEALKALKREIKSQSARLHDDWKYWLRLSKEILKSRMPNTLDLCLPSQI